MTSIHIKYMSSRYFFQKTDYQIFMRKYHICQAHPPVFEQAKKRGCIISQSKEIVSDNYLAARRLHRFTQIFLWKIYDFHLRKSALSAGE